MSRQTIVTCDQTGAVRDDADPNRIWWVLTDESAVPLGPRMFDFGSLQSLIDWLLSADTRQRYTEQIQAAKLRVWLLLNRLCSWRRTAEPIPPGLSIERYVDAAQIERVLVRLAHGEDVVTLEYQHGVAVGLFFDAHEVNGQ